MGIVGGKPERSLHFVGSHGNSLICVDPQLMVQEAFSRGQVHDPNVRAVALRKLDPGSVLPGFHCAGREDLFVLRDLTQQLFGSVTGVKLLSWKWRRSA